MSYKGYKSQAHGYCNTAEIFSEKFVENKRSEESTHFLRTYYD